MTVTLRPYQADLVSDTYAAWNQGAQNVLMHLATGGGKTAGLSYIVDQHDGASCVIAHRSELVSQVSQSLAAYGVEHDIIASDATRRIVAAVHVLRFGRCYLRVGARCRVASVDTLIRRTGFESWAATVTLWVVDECFPAGTLVDGRPIETLKPGDHVTAFNEETGGFEQRPIVRLFKNLAPVHMVSIEFGSHHVITCTAGHPFWSRRGWVAAVDLNPSDEVLLYDGNVHDLRDAYGGDEVPHRPIETNGADLLRANVLEGIPPQDFFGDDGAHESQIRFGSDDFKQPGAPRGGAGKDQRDAQGAWGEADSSGRQRQTSAGGGTDVDIAVCGLGIYGPVRSADSEGARERLSVVLQTGLREPSLEAGVGIGRSFAWDGEPQIAGQEKRRVSRWAGVDRVTVFERGDNEQPGRGRDDGYVYNIEVEGLHTYVADGVVVHNCHHLVNDNKWHRAISLFTHPGVRGLMPTATPCRADGKGLGRHADGVADMMVSGPPPRWLIEEGWLCDYDVMCPTSDMDVLADVAASGDWSPKVLKEASQKSHIVGDVVGSYLDAARGRLGVTFATDVETATQMAGAYRAAGVTAEVLTGETDDRLRAATLARFERREVMQLCVVDIVSEGFDLPAIEVLSMARPTQSLGLYMQQFGRGLRPVFAPGHSTGTREQRHAAQMASGKGRKVLLLDHVGNFIRHQGGPDAPRTWSLDRREKRSKGASDAESLRVCLECLKPFKRIMTACPHCGAEIPPPMGRSGPEQVDGDLALLSPEVLEALRAELPVSEGEYRERLMAQRLPEIPFRANMKRHRERLDALGMLRHEIAVWSGALHAQGLSDREIHKAWWLEWGCTVYDALGQSARDAMAMTAKLKERAI